jgi:hypothetical protein
MDFIYSDLKVEEQWVVHSLILRKMKSVPFLPEHQIKVNFSFVIGQLEVLIKQEVKMIQ